MSWSQSEIETCDPADATKVPLGKARVDSRNREELERERWVIAALDQTIQLIVGFCLLVKIGRASCRERV